MLNNSQRVTLLNRFLNRDVSSAPPNAAQLQYLDLYMESPSGGSLFVSRLATNLDVKTGSITITVPQARAGKYFVMRKCSPVAL